MLDVQTDFGTLHQCSRFFEKWCKTAIFWAEFRTELHLFLSRFLRASYDTSNIIDLNIFIKLLWLIFYKVNEISRESFISNYHENDCNTMHMFIEVHFNQFFQADFFRYFHGTAGITLFFQMIGEAGFFAANWQNGKSKFIFWFSGWKSHMICFYKHIGKLLSKWNFPYTSARVR